jgi:hypothetical protein
MYFSCWSWSNLADDLASRYNAHTSSRSAYMLSRPTKKEEEENTWVWYWKTFLAYIQSQTTGDDVLIQSLPCVSLLDHSFSPQCWQVIIAELHAWREREREREREYQLKHMLEKEGLLICTSRKFMNFIKTSRTSVVQSLQGRLDSLHLSAVPQPAREVLKSDQNNRSPSVAIKLVFDSKITQQFTPPVSPQQDHNFLFG